MLINTNDLANCEQVYAEYNKELNNMLHILEDCSNDAVELVKMAKKIGQLRKERRYYAMLCTLKRKGWDEAGKMDARLTSWKEMAEQNKQRILYES